jgi:putative FmdB family regulatory protein
VPIYEYRCPKGHVFELFQRMDDAPAETCQICGEGPVEKVLYPVAVHFKGSGFYSTDYGRSRKTAKEGEGGGDDKPTDSKPKPEPKQPETPKTEAKSSD